MGECFILILFFSVLLSLDGLDIEHINAPSYFFFFVFIYRPFLVQHRKREHERITLFNVT